MYRIFSNQSMKTPHHPLEFDYKTTGYVYITLFKRTCLALSQYAGVFAILNKISDYWLGGISKILHCLSSFEV